MKDLEGKELEVGAIYHILGSGRHLVICKFKAETEVSVIFKPIKNYRNLQGQPTIHTWKRVLTKYWGSNIVYTHVGVIRVSQEILDKYNIS